VKFQETPLTVRAVALVRLRPVMVTVALAAAPAGLKLVIQG
jgi:hypothetical protein